ncbi:protein ATP6V1FNB-like [Schistocerca serialis cubense]|uniref:protein ATP6V1FNB-like n=2 Tax=Schistocerca TaxID=7008 RepID=UPI00214E5E5A|nr:protein ATP6V1FNB-like [Schistocerca serialis cubense]
MYNQQFRWSGAYDAQTQRLGCERVLKEAKMTLRWLHENRDLAYGRAGEQRSPATQQLLNELEYQGFAPGPLETWFTGPGKIETYLVPQKLPPLPSTDPRCTLHTMRPIPEDQEKLLYTGPTRDGRLKYLSLREKVSPIDRYYYPASVNQRYGWLAPAMRQALNRPECARSEQPRRAALRRKDVRPDPPGLRRPLTTKPPERAEL